MISYRRATILRNVKHRLLCIADVVNETRNSLFVLLELLPRDSISGEIFAVTNWIAVSSRIYEFIVFGSLTQHLMRCLWCTPLGVTNTLFLSHGGQWIYFGCRYHVYTLDNKFIRFCLQAEALAEKNQRDLEVQFEQEEKRVRDFDFIDYFLR